MSEVTSQMTSQVLSNHRAPKPIKVSNEKRAGKREKIYAG